MAERLISDEEAQRNRAARKLLRNYQGEVGPEAGNLHIALADSNLSDEHLEFCFDRARGLKDWLGAAVAALMLTMDDVTRRECVEFWWSGI